MTARPARRASWLLGFAAAFTGLLLFIGFFGAAVARRTAAEFLAGGMPEEAVIIGQGSSGLGFFRWTGQEVPRELAVELRRDPEVLLVSVEEALGLPTSVQGSLFGCSYGSDVVALGVDSAAMSWVAPGLSPAEFTDRRPLPVIAPQLVLDAYNQGFAPANGLPRLDAAAFLGRGFTLVAGASSLRQSLAVENVPCRLAAFSPRRDCFGVILPLDFVERCNALSSAVPAGRRLFVFAKTPAAAERLVAEMRRRGFEVSSPAERLKSLVKLDLLIAAVAVGGGGVIAALAAVSALFAGRALVLERRHEAELLHHLAWPRPAIILRFVKTLTAPAAIGAAIGAAVGEAAALALRRGGAPFLPLIAWPEPRFRDLIGLAAFLLPVIATALGAALGARALIPEWKNRNG